jgi:hypothetical protein
MLLDLSIISKTVLLALISSSSTTTSTVYRYPAVQINQATAKTKAMLNQRESEIGGSMLRYLSTVVRR